ncbi:MAG: hypothetical protein AAB303_04795 [Chloroflexota bacterium]
MPGPLQASDYSAVIGRMAQYVEGHEILAPSLNDRLQPLNAF